MKTMYLLGAWVMLLLNLVLALVIRGMRKRHAREVINLVDDSTTSRDKLAQLRAEIQNYKRVQQTDSAMIERLLKHNDQQAQDAMAREILLSKYRNLSSFAYERMHDARRWFETGTLMPGTFTLIHETLRQLYTLEMKPDAGKPTKPAAGNGGAESQTTAE